MLSGAVGCRIEWQMAKSMFIDLYFSRRIINAKSGTNSEANSAACAEG